MDWKVGTIYIIEKSMMRRFPVQIVTFDSNCLNISMQNVKCDRFIIVKDYVGEKYEN